MDLLGHLVMIVENQLSVIVQPVEGQILHAYGGPLVKDLPPRAVNDVRDLIGNHKFKVLRAKLISQEEAIPHLNSTQNIWK